MGDREVFEPETEDIRLTDVLAAVGDPVRLRLLGLISAHREPCVAYADMLGVHKSTSSHHLKVLREAGVTHTRVDGRLRYVSVRREDLDARFPGLLDPILTEARSVADQAAAQA